MEAITLQLGSSQSTENIKKVAEQYTRGSRKTAFGEMLESARKEKSLSAGISEEKPVSQDKLSSNQSIKDKGVPTGNKVEYTDNNQSQLQEFDDKVQKSKDFVIEDNLVTTETLFFTSGDNGSLSVNLTQEDISFLETVEKVVDFDDLIKNASSYDEISSQELLQNSQNLSVSDPQHFLEIAEAIKNKADIRDNNFNAVMSESGETLLESSLNEISGMDLTSAGFGKNGEVTPLNVKQVQDHKLFAITDLRSPADQLESVDLSSLGTDTLEELKKELDGDVLTVTEKNSDNTYNMLFNVSEGIQQNIMTSDSQSASANGSVFQQMLTNSLQNNAPEFVKAGSIILRDQGQGTINLNLNPESLGNVKVSLELSDKVIAGQITVHSKEAYEAFKQSIDSLRQAFVDNGFDSANLTLSFQDNSSGNAFAQNQGSGNENSDRAFFAHRAYNDYQDEDTFVHEEVSLGQIRFNSNGSSGIDVVA